MSMRIKAVVDRFVEELKEALDADIQDRIMKEREMQSYIQEREREVSEREAAWKAELSRREAEIARQEARLKAEKENLEKEKSVLMGTASNQDNQDGALEITDSCRDAHPRLFIAQENARYNTTLEDQTLARAYKLRVFTGGLQHVNLLPELVAIIDDPDCRIGKLYQL
ncbi:hypothetical protein OIU85_028552 [Salix viminalis]|uniref:Uncharacterized protein n=1 Tax=Salix viminalis TaxID=40686 RepID=A0A9Q0QKR8_SALVM|nr:hypothetical protein OIU85_028552 [Salix viminalis]